MQTDIKGREAEGGSGVVAALAGGEAGSALPQHSCGARECGGGPGDARRQRRPDSAFLGLRIAMPLALLLWGLVVTALWSLMR